MTNNTLIDLIVQDELNKQNNDPEYARAATEDANRMLAKIAPDQKFTKEQFAVVTGIAVMMMMRQFTF